MNMPNNACMILVEKTVEENRKLISECMATLEDGLYQVLIDIVTEYVFELRTEPWMHHIYVDVLMFGKPYGKTSAIRCDGFIKSETYYRDGRETNVFTYHSNGRLRYRLVSTGETTELESHWYKGGARKKICEYNNHTRHGNYTKWYVSGQIEALCTYVNGIPNGDFTTWYCNGQIATFTYYVNGKPNGAFCKWDENGVLLYRGLYSKH